MISSQSQDQSSTFQEIGLNISCFRKIANNKMPPDCFNGHAHYYPGQFMQGYYANAHPPYVETKMSKPVEEKQQCQKKVSVGDMKFSPEDLALATVPGAQFDPSKRSFDIEELKPQPIIKKRSKIFVSNDSKDDKYWEKRIKNNVAARRY